MLETPEAAPTCSAETHAVEADVAGPFASPIPTATAISGRTNAAYRHEPSTKPTSAKPRAGIAKPAPTTGRPPNRAATRGTNGAIATSPAVAGRVARPACNELSPSVDGSWK